MAATEATIDVGVEVSPEDEAAAVAAKDEGNALLKEFRLAEAIEAYSRAIELDPRQAVFYSNRAMAYIKKEEYGAALGDANVSIELDPSYIKGYYRRGTANFALGHAKDALKDFRAVCKIRPKDRQARMKLKEADRAVKEMAFAAAIVSDYGPRSYFEGLDEVIAGITVDDSYTGPHIGEDGITHDFVVALIEHYKDQGKLHKKYALQILVAVKEIFEREPTLLRISVPEGGHFTVCGDVHGQFYDLANIFEINGHPSATNGFLFNGDFVDRGSFSVEVIFTLFAWKILHPTTFFMERGNHETKNMNRMYGFSGELAAKYDSTMIEGFTEVFNCLPLASVIGDQVMTVHGGLFQRDGVTLADIEAIDRFREPPDDSLMADMLWSDPQPFPGRAPSKRGIGKSFGPDITKAFLDANNLKMLIRSHEVKPNGYEIEVDGRLVTVFSAPNYCDQVGNKGAFIKFSEDMEPQYISFDAVPHPEVRPMAYASPLFGM